MSIKNRRFSLDSFVSQEGVSLGLLGGRRGSKIGKKSKKSQSLEDSQLEFQELKQSYSRSNSLRPQITEEDGLDRSEGLITKVSFVKHNKAFHKLFPDIPEGEDVTHTFSCALQKEVLYHGKLFVSENYICFYSSVLLKDTKVVILASSVMQVKKQKTALSKLSVRNGDGEKFSFVSLRNREMCYKLLLSICLQSQPGESANSSPRMSSAENGGDQDTLSGNSSPEDSVDLDLSKNYSLDNVYPLMSNGVTGRCSSTPRNSSTPEEEETATESWIWRIVESARSFLLSRNINTVTLVFYIYLVLVVMLLLTSGYVGLRIVALENQLNSLGALHDFSLDHRERTDT